ncbi:MAG: hypothetical protein IPO27_09200 [Bacteroidetes bacterium]|nr:hypothetical protein [Bacteroidota bacterium]
MKKTILNTLFFLAIISVVTSCKKDKDDPENPPPTGNEQEIITTLKLIFKDSANLADVRSATFRDPDGDGGLGPNIFDTIKLDANKTWLTEIVLLNETVNPVDSISNEVLEEANDHLFCYTATVNIVEIVVTDKDGNSLPIGIQSKWTTKAVGQGTVQAVLKHQPGTKNGQCNIGETDIDVTFQMQVQ